MKLLRIDDCGLCPDASHTQSRNTWWCSHKDIVERTLDVDKGIPDWCPLPDEAVEEMLEIMEKARRWNMVLGLADAAESKVCARCGRKCPEDQCGFYSARYVKAIIDDEEAPDAP